MIGSIVLFNFKGEVLTYQNYREGISRNHADIFRANVIHSRHALKSPIVTISGISYFFIRKQSFWLVAISNENCNAAMVFQFLHNIFAALDRFFSNLTPEKIDSKIMVISDILSEVGDNGVPQLTDPSSLSALLSCSDLKVSNKATQSQLTVQVTGQIGWRKNNIIHKKHELFLDIKEQVHCLMSSDGEVLTSHVLGVVQMKSSLSGMPVCSLGINDKMMSTRPSSSVKSKKTVAIDGCNFHQSVKLSQYESDSSITFTPPDGTFELMNYRTAANEIPFRIISIVRDAGKNKVEMSIVLKSKFSDRMSATSMVVTVPLPRSTSSVSIKTTKGSGKFSKGEMAILWKIRKMQGMQDAQLVVTVSTMDNVGHSKEGSKNVSIAFKIEQGFSGMKILYLRVVESKLGYTEKEVAKWVRYQSRNGLYEVRSGHA